MPGAGETWDDRQAGKGRNAVAQGGLLAADLTRISKTEEKKRDDGDFPRSHAEDPGRLSPPPWHPLRPCQARTNGPSTPGRLWPARKQCNKAGRVAAAQDGRQIPPSRRISSAISRLGEAARVDGRKAEAGGEVDEEVDADVDAEAEGDDGN